VDPGGAGEAPSDAIVLFNGPDNSGWTTLEGKPLKYTVADGVVIFRIGASDMGAPGGAARAVTGHGRQPRVSYILNCWVLSSKVASTVSKLVGSVAGAGESDREWRHL
jgi:hypothetical protein